MGTLAPAVADAFDLLHMKLHRHLDAAEFLALTCQEWTGDDVNTARKLIPDLVIVIRGLLLGHQMRPSGNCRTCGSVWPCPVVALIQALLKKDPEHQYVALAPQVSL
ncbi:MAG: hypothetical protein ACRDTA_10715 [Pseudonocardiaceae bacterium]